MRRGERGQALVEFSLAIVVFLVLLMAVFDFGRAIMQYNGVAQAAREIARVTAVHEGTDFTTTAGRSPETSAPVSSSALIANAVMVGSDGPPRNAGKPPSALSETVPA